MKMQMSSYRLSRVVRRWHRIRFEEMAVKPSRLGMVDWDESDVTAQRPSICELRPCRIYYMHGMRHTGDMTDCGIHPKGYLTYLLTSPCKCSSFYLSFHCQYTPIESVPKLKYSRTLPTDIPNHHKSKPATPSHPLPSGSPFSQQYS